MCHWLKYTSLEDDKRNAVDWNIKIENHTSTDKINTRCYVYLDKYCVQVLQVDPHDLIPLLHFHHCGWPCISEKNLDDWPRSYQLSAHSWHRLHPSAQCLQEYQRSIPLCISATVKLFTIMKLRKEGGIYNLHLHWNQTTKIINLPDTVCRRATRCRSL